MDFKKEVENLNIFLNSEMEEKFETYFRVLVETNEKMNLTAITEKEEVYCKHFLDSLEITRAIENDSNFTLCDVGSGAGFPAIPLKICFPHLQITIIEPTLKRIKFLEMLIEKLELKGINLINARAEDVANQYLEQFDICTARAVANTSILLELLAKMVKVKGRIVLYKGDKGLEESKESLNACKILDLRLIKENVYKLSNNYGTRCLLEYLKEKSTNNKYPRRYAEIKKRPL